MRPLTKGLHCLGWRPSRHHPPCTLDTSPLPLHSGRRLIWTTAVRQTRAGSDDLRGAAGGVRTVTAHAWARGGAGPGRASVERCGGERAGDSLSQATPWLAAGRAALADGDGGVAERRTREADATAASPPLLDSPREPLSPSLILALIEVSVPTVLVAVTQIARSVPDAVMEALCALPEGSAGLAGYLASHPDLFAVTRIGSVVVSRRLRPSTRLTLAQARQLMHTEARPPGRSRSRSAGAPGLPDAVARAVPSFLVPVRELLCAGNPAVSGEHEWRRFLQSHRAHLRYVNPFQADALDNGDEETWKYGYVSTHPLHHSEASAAVGAVGFDGAQEVPMHECYRVARVLPAANTPVLLDAAMQAEMRALLPADRSLLHVLYSAPTLFQVTTESPLHGRVGAAAAGETSAAEEALGGGRFNESALTIRCQFSLDSSYALHVPESRESLLAALEKLRSDRSCDRSSSTRRLPQRFRAKQRSYRRRLQYLTNVTPYFDDNVLALQLLDSMPADGPIPVPELVCALPPSARNCLPGNLRTIFSKYPNYFVYYHDGVSDGALVQRADLPRPAVRDISTIDAFEVLQAIFTRYPRRHHPYCGTCVAMCIAGLPFPIVLRIRQMHDFSDEVLRRFPDKVEIMSESAATQGLLGSPEKVAELSRQTRNRKDFFVPFRFIGEWQEKLLERYTEAPGKRKMDPEQGVCMGRVVPD